MVKVILETFKNTQNPPALIMKTSSAGFSVTDRVSILEKIDMIKSDVNKVIISGKNRLITFPLFVLKYGSYLGELIKDYFKINTPLNKTFIHVIC